MKENQKFIEKVLKDFIYTGDIKYKQKNGEKKLIYQKFLASDIYKDKRARVYCLVSEKNNVVSILKFGKSNNAGGLYSSIQDYLNAGKHHSVTRIKLREKLHKKVFQAYKIKVYVQFLDFANITRKVLSKKKTFLVPPDPAFLEREYIERYRAYFGRTPRWNYVEDNRKIDD